jgi:hypothetical protein
MSNYNKMEEVSLSNKGTSVSKVTNDKIVAVLKHNICKKGGQTSGIELVIKNVSSEIIGSALFKVIFRDKDGNIIDTVEHKALDLKPDMAKTIYILSSKPEHNKIESYTIELVKTIVIPAPIATGNDALHILKHEIHEDNMMDVIGANSDCIELVIKNASSKTINKAILSVEFYDIEGNLISNFEHRETNIKFGNSRHVLIFPPKPIHHLLKSYNIKEVRVTTADVEKVIVHGNNMWTNGAGEEEIEGTVKNLSDTRTDAVLLASFCDDSNETIGTKAVILRDIDPDMIRKFHFTFKPQLGDKLKTCNLQAICDIDECTCT